MKRRNFVKLTAMATAAAIAISPAMVFAEDSQDGATTAGSKIEGAGNLEDFVNKDVFKVTLPTTAAGDADFTLDPQGLLAIASNDYKLGVGAIYFKNKPTSTGGATTYSDTSDPIEIINKSSYAVDVAFSVKVELPEGVTMVEKEADLANATTPSIYLTMKEDEDTAVTVLKEGDNTAAVKNVGGVAEGDTGYKIKATPKTGGASGYDYSYALVDDFDPSTAKKASYKLSGKCDSKADWSAINALADDKKSVKTTIVWSAKKHMDSYLDVATMTASSNTATLTLPNGVTLSKVEITHDDGTGSIVLSDQYTLSGTTFTVPAGNITAWLGIDPAYTKMVLTFSDGKTNTITFQQ